MARYYFMKQTMPYIEDMTHEFKGHVNLRDEEIQSICFKDGKASRQRISKVLNAFLNTGLGGTVYIGVLDSGLIEGMHFTQYRKDHLQLALDDVMKSYDPPIEKHRYSLTFVPVINPKENEEINDLIINYDTAIEADDEMRKKQHKLRTSNFCWCHKEQIVNCNRGIIPANFIAEICIYPWDPLDKRNVNGILPPYNIRPIHMDENGEVYFRKAAGVKRYPRNEIANISKAIVATHFKKEIEELQNKLKDIQVQ